VNLWAKRHTFNQDCVSHQLFAGFFVADWFEVRTTVARGGSNSGRVVIELIYTAAEVGFEVRVHREVVLHVGAGVTNCETSATSVGRVGLRTVDGAIVVDGAFASLEFKLHGAVGIEV
jgi:hypothetical protein